MKCTYFDFCHNFPHRGNTCNRCRARLRNGRDPATPPDRQSRSEYGVLAIGTRLNYSPAFLLDYLLDSPLDEKTQEHFEPHGPRNRAKAKWVKRTGGYKKPHYRDAERAREAHISKTLKEVAFG